MKQGWESKKLGDVYDVRDGTHDSPKYQDSGFPLVTSKNLKDGSITLDKIKYISKIDYLNINKRSKVDIGDILFAMIGTIGNPVVVMKEPDFAIKNVALFKVPEEQSSAFLKYYLEFVTEAMKGDAKGSTQKFVGLGYLRGFEIRLPELQEQKQIVAKLDSSFEAIDKAKANAAKNLENTKELFQSKLNDIFSQKGEGWVEKKLGDVCEKTINIKWANFPDDEFEYIDLSAVSRTSLKITGTTTVNASNAPSRAKKIIQTNDIMFATTRPTLKRVAIVLSEFNDQICSTGYTVLRGIKGVINHKLIYYFLQTDIFMDRMESIQRGTSYPAVTDKDVKDSVMSLPVSKIQQQDVTNKLDALKEQTQSLESKYLQALNSLEELKKSILQKAFAGEL